MGVFQIERNVAVEPIVHMQDLGSNGMDKTIVHVREIDDKNIL